MRFLAIILLLFALLGCGSGSQPANEVNSKAQKQNDKTTLENTTSPVTPIPEQVETQEQGNATKKSSHSREIDGLRYELDYERAFEKAHKTNQPVFLNFTWRDNEYILMMEKRLEKPQLRKLLTNFIRVQVFVDSVPFIENQSEEELILKKNRKFQALLLENVTLPSFAIMTPDGKVLAKVLGMQSEDDLTKFLDKGLSEWKK